jgi:hypothetical protein
MKADLERTRMQLKADLERTRMQRAVARDAVAPGSAMDRNDL